MPGNDTQPHPRAAFYFRTAVQAQPPGYAPGYYDFGIAGYSDPTTRSGFARLLNDAETGKFDVVIVTSLDRISRDPVVTLGIIDRLAGYSVGVVSLLEEIDTLTEAGRREVETMRMTLEMQGAPDERTSNQL